MRVATKVATGSGLLAALLIAVLTYFAVLVSAARHRRPGAHGSPLSGQHPRTRSPASTRSARDQRAQVLRHPGRGLCRPGQRRTRRVCNRAGGVGDARRSRRRVHGDRPSRVGLAGVHARGRGWVHDGGPACGRLRFPSASGARGPDRESCTTKPGRCSISRVTVSPHRSRVRPKQGAARSTSPLWSPASPFSSPR